MTTKNKAINVLEWEIYQIICCGVWRVREDGRYQTWLFIAGNLLLLGTYPATDAGKAEASSDIHELSAFLERKAPYTSKDVEEQVEHCKKYLAGEPVLPTEREKIDLLVQVVEAHRKGRHGHV